MQGGKRVVYVIIGVVISVAMVAVIVGLLFILWKRGLLRLPRLSHPEPRGISNPGYETTLNFPSVAVSDLNAEAPQVDLRGMADDSATAWLTQNYFTWTESWAMYSTLPPTNERVA